MKRHLDKMFAVKDKNIDVGCRIKSSLNKNTNVELNKKMSKNYFWIIENKNELEEKLNRVRNVEHLWQVEKMLESAVVSEFSTLEQTMWLLEKLIESADYAQAMQIIKAEEIIKQSNDVQRSLLVWAYIWSEANAMKNKKLIEEFASRSELVRKKWKFSAFISEQDYSTFSQYGSAAPRELKNPGLPTLNEILMAPSMIGKNKDDFDVHAFFNAFPEFKDLERNPAWGKYGGYALESLSQIMYGPIKMAAECLWKTKSG